MKAGDHVRILKDGSWLHAIDVGDRTVIHFAPGAGARRARVEEIAGGGARVEVVTHTARVYPPSTVVARAFSRFEPAYASMFADSEAFAVWCKTGQAPARAAPRDDAAPPATLAERAVAAVDTVLAAAEPVRRIARAAKAVVAAAAGTKRRATKSSKAKPKRKAAPAKSAPLAKAKAAPRRGPPLPALSPAGAGAREKARGAKPKKGMKPKKAAAAKSPRSRPAAKRPRKSTAARRTAARRR
jgi:hypothetical protein